MRDGMAKTLTKTKEICIGTDFLIAMYKQFKALGANAQLSMGEKKRVDSAMQAILDELAVKKMQAMDEEIRQGKKKVYTLAQMKELYPEAF